MNDNTIHPNEREIQKNFLHRVRKQFDRIKTYYQKEFELCPDLKPALKKYCAVMEIKRDIRASFQEDDPVEIKKLINTEINGIKITKETYQNILLVDQEFNKHYGICKKILRDLSLNRSKYINKANDNSEVSS